MDDPFRAIAFHEAGHVVVGHAVGMQITVARIADTFDASGEMGIASYGPTDATLLTDLLAFYLAGLSAERRINGDAQMTPGDQGMIDQYLAEEPLPTREPYLSTAGALANRVLADNWQFVEMVAERLLRDREIPGEEIKRMLATLPPVTYYAT